MCALSCNDSCIALTEEMQRRLIIIQQIFAIGMNYFKTKVFDIFFNVNVQFIV